jgi:hypothetical protein
MAENKLVKILNESTRRNNKRIENRLVEILNESLARNPSAGAPPAAQNLLRNKTVDDLVRILKNLTPKQNEALGKSGTPPVVAAAMIGGTPLPENKTPEELVGILKATLSSNSTEKTKTEVSAGVMKRFSDWFKTTGKPALSEAYVKAGAAGTFGAGVVVDAVGEALKLLSSASEGLKNQLKVLRGVPAVHREWMVQKMAPTSRGIKGPQRTIGSGIKVPSFPSGLLSWRRSMATNGAGGAGGGQGGLGPALSTVNWRTLRSVNALLNARNDIVQKNGLNKVPRDLNMRISNTLKRELGSLGYNAGPERIRKYTTYFKKAGSLGNWRYDLIELIRQKVDSITRESSSPQRAREKLRDFKSSIGVGYYGSNSNVSRIFLQAERNLNRRLNEDKRRKMNENRNKRGLPPLPARNNSRSNMAPPVFRPPANQPQPNLYQSPLALPPPPPLNMGEQRAIANIPGGANRALNLVQNAGGPNNVLKAANQIKEFGDPVAAIAHGANAKNVKIVLQLGGANNAAKVATAAPKLARRRRSKKAKKTKTKARPKILAIKKLLRSLPKKKLLAVLPKSNKAALANKNKANVATRVTSYLAGRTKTKK